MTHAFVPSHRQSTIGKKGYEYSRRPVEDPPSGSTGTAGPDEGIRHTNAIAFVLSCVLSSAALTLVSANVTRK